MGSICRFGLSRFNAGAQHFPWGTFLANAISCLVLGALLGWHLRNGLSAEYRLWLMTGFCGGFSTFSTFSMETLQLLQSGQWTIALINVFGSLAVGVICLYLGMKMMG